MVKCNDCFRIVFIICNIPIFLLGLALIGVGIWQVVLDNTIEQLFSKVNGKITGGLFITSGGMLTVFSILGVVGACFKSRLTLTIYWVIIFLATVAEIGAGGYALAKASDIEQEQAENDFINALTHYFPSESSAFNDQLNDAVDLVQENLECCGVISIDDWRTYSPYHMLQDRLPSSCCGRDEPDPCPFTEAFTDTCGEPFFDFVVQNSQSVGIIGIVFAIYNVVLLVESFILIIVIHLSFR